MVKKQLRPDFIDLRKWRVKRDSDKWIIFWVCYSISETYKLELFFVRMIFIILLFFWWVWALLYLALGIIMPNIKD